MMTAETATHTPGPWAQSGQTIRSAAGINIARTAFNFAVDQSEDAQWNGGGPLEPEAAANAALITAAPGLLAAAEAMIGSFSWLLDEASDAHGKCNLSDDTECREGSRPTDHEEIRDAYVLRRVIKTTIAQAREGGAS